MSGIRLSFVHFHTIGLGFAYGFVSRESATLMKKIVVCVKKYCRLIKVFIFGLLNP